MSVGLRLCNLVWLNKLHLLLWRTARRGDRIGLILQSSLCTKIPRTDLLWIACDSRQYCAADLITNFRCRHNAGFNLGYFFLGEVREIEIRAFKSMNGWRVLILDSRCHVGEAWSSFYHTRSHVIMLFVFCYVYMPFYICFREYCWIWSLWSFRGSPYIWPISFWYNWDISVIPFSFSNLILLLNMPHYLQPPLNTLNNLLLSIPIVRQFLRICHIFWISVLQFIKVLGLLLLLDFIHHLFAFTFRVCGASMDDWFGLII